MKLRTGYRLALLWLSLVAILRAVDLGIRTGRFELAPGDVADMVTAVVEEALHTAVIYGLRSRYRWGWGLTAVWVPVWIVLMSTALLREGDLLLGVFWTPLFCGSALAHRFLLRDDIREAFGILRRPWRTLWRWLPRLTLSFCAFLPLAFVFDPGVAGAVVLTSAIASAVMGRAS